jgi:hypothetical protein
VEALTHLDAERTVLGCSIADSGSVNRAVAILSATDFSSDL